MEIAILAVEVLRRMLQKAGPYLMVEILLPGGTLLALALLLYRRRKSISNA